MKSGSRSSWFLVLRLGDRLDEVFQFDRIDRRNAEGCSVKDARCVGQRRKISGLEHP
jgi:hypothetical protein